MLDKSFRLVYFLFLCLLLTDRLVHLFVFSFHYADSDQTIQWLGVVEMMQGRFHEPAFYGQPYNTLFEAFLAIPLVYLGLPVHMALPSVAAFLGVFPFVLLSVLAIPRNKNAALFFIAFPLLLPAEYVLLTQLPRGFVAGIAAATVAAAILIFTPKITAKQLFFSALAGGFSLVLNPNGLLLLVPIYLWALLTAEKKLKTILWLFAGALPGFFTQAGVAWFYHKNPYYVSHCYADMKLSAANIANAFSHFHELFYGLFPFLLFAGVAIVPTILFIIYKLYGSAHKNFAWALVGMLVFMLITFTSSKMIDGTASIFFSYSRIYLALPLVVSIGFYFLFTVANFPFSFKKWIVPGVFILIFFAIKITVINERVAWNIKNNSGWVSVFKINERVACYNKLEACAQKLAINTIIFCEKKDEYNYGLMAHTNSKLRTISLAYERKKWLMKSLEQEKTNRFLFWCEQDSILTLPGLNPIKVPGEYPLYIVSTDKNPVTYFREKKVLNYTY